MPDSDDARAARLAARLKRRADNRAKDDAAKNTATALMPVGAPLDDAGETGVAQPVSKARARAGARDALRRYLDGGADPRTQLPWSEAIALRLVTTAVHGETDRDAIRAAEAVMLQTELPLEQVFRHEVTQRQLSVVVHIGSAGLPFDATAQAALAAVAAGDRVATQPNTHYQTRLPRVVEAQQVTPSASDYEQRIASTARLDVPSRPLEPALGPIDATASSPGVSRVHPTTVSHAATSAGAPSPAQGPQVPLLGSPAAKKSKLTRGAGGKAVNVDAPFEPVKRAPKGPQYPKRSDYAKEAPAVVPERIERGGVGWMP